MTGFRQRGIPCCHTAPMLAVLCLVACGYARAELPPIETLLRDARDACQHADDDRPLLSDKTSAVHDVATAYALMGDMDGAEKTLRLWTDNEAILEDALLWMHIDATGESPKLLAPPNDEAAAWQRVKLALGFANRGYFEKAKQQIGLVSSPGSTARFVSDTLTTIAKKQKEQGLPDDAVETCLASKQYLAKVNDLLRPDDLIKGTLNLSQIYAELGQAEPAKEMAVKARGILDVQAESDSADKYACFRWAQLGDILLMLGNDRGATECYRRAITEMDAVEKTDETFRDRRPTYLSDFCLARARAYMVRDRKEEALKSLAQALKWLRQQQPERTDPDSGVAPDLAPVFGFLNDILDAADIYRFQQIALEQQKAGDTDAAIETLKVLPICTIQLVAFREMVQYARSLDNKDEARRLTRVVLDMSQGSSQPTERAAGMVSAGAMYLDISDMDTARKLFDQALELSNEAEFCVPRDIAAIYVEVGKFEEAYEMLQTIEDVKDRAVPLALLAKEVARKRAKQRNETSQR